MTESTPSAAVTTLGLASWDSGGRLEPAETERCCTAGSTRPPPEPRRNIQRRVAFGAINGIVRTLQDYARWSGDASLPSRSQWDRQSFPVLAAGLRNDAENRASRRGRRRRRCHVQVPIQSSNQCCSRILAIGASRLRAKAVERGQRAAHSYFEHRPAAVGPIYSQNVVPYKLPLRARTSPICGNLPVRVKKVSQLTEFQVIISARLALIALLAISRILKIIVREVWRSRLSRYVTETTTP